MSKIWNGIKKYFWKVSFSGIAIYMLQGFEIVFKKLEVESMSVKGVSFYPLIIWLFLFFIFKAREIGLNDIEKELLKKRR